MDEAVQVGTEQRESAEAREHEDPRVARAKRRADGDHGREMIEHVVQGATLDEQEEADALDWLLGDPVPVPYEVTVQVDTPKGLAPLTFVFLPPDGRKLDTLEQRHRGQDGVVKVLDLDVDTVVTFTEHVENAKGREIKLSSEEFRTVRKRNAESGEVESVLLASANDAVMAKLGRQLGLITAVAREMRRTGGWDARRQGDAQRRLVKAALD